MRSTISLIIEMHLEFRQATAIDLDFLDEMHTACMKEHVVKVYPWNPELFRQTFNPKLIQIILVNKVEVGMLQISKRNGELYLGNFLVTPAFQNRGIGTAVLKKVLDRGKLLELPIKLKVLKKNRAKNLYERLGFTVTGKTDTHYIMSSV